ncbi:monocarboxylate transporter 14 isoform X1 [Octopus bimaculoides]|uniref:Major facilitator superfamily (MFS) profile domain-containing protein n=1 Tax=Octopus bimaculoides TaxID=37653 RepID=A0A0L8FFS7_OCTBM|nr:monocarboxylate transporter 14 isoform X1 [Octopus bimaculoides]|eukprot:XP_014790367.1 PREDICTED: monocarboxylate transporter 14-like [Octopus bimaculoides]
MFRLKMAKNNEIIIQVNLLNAKSEGKRNLTEGVTEICPQKGMNPGFCEDDECINRESDINVTPDQPVRTVECTPEGHTSSQCSSFMKYLSYVFILYNNVLGFGFAYSLGILYTYFIREFNTTKSETAMITSACSATLGGAGIFAGMLYRKIGIGRSYILASALCSIGLFASSFTPNIWFLFFSLGILFGSGAAINNIVSYAALEKLFHQNVQILSIILTLCAPFGILCVPYLVNFLLNIYSWRGALLIISGFCLNMCFSGLLSKVDRKPKSDAKVERLKIFDIKILKNKRFLILSTSASVNTCCGSLLLLLIVDFWVGKGHPMLEGITLVTFVSISSLASRLVFCFFSLLFDIRPVLILIFYIVCGTSGTFFIFAPLCDTYSPLVFLIVLNGFSRGLFSTLRPLVFKKVVGIEAYPLAIGYTYTVTGICAIPMATIVGKITDLTQSYDFAFYLTGLFEILMVLLLGSTYILITCMRKKNHKFKLEN